jgi:hypothetical protein
MPTQLFSVHSPPTGAETVTDYILTFTCYERYNSLENTGCLIGPTMKQLNNTTQKCNGNCIKIFGWKPGRDEIFGRPARM